MEQDKKKKKRIIYFIWAIIGLIAFSPVIDAYKRSKVNFYVERVEENFVYHISLDCENIKNPSDISEVKEFFFTMNSAVACDFCNKSYTRLNN